MCTALLGMSVKLTRAVGARIDGKTFMELEMDECVDLDRMKNLLTQYQKIRKGMESIEVFVFDEGNSACDSLKTASKNGLVISWRQSETISSPVETETDSMLDLLEAQLSINGFWDPKKALPLSPSPKSNLIYSKLDEANAPNFCVDAVNTIAENIMFSLAKPDSPFRRQRLDEVVKNFRDISDQKDYPSAIALSLLVHASKSKSVSRFFSLAMKLAARKLSILPAPEIYQKASELLESPHLKKLLLHGTSLGESALDEIRTEFVSIADTGLRGWSGPSMIVINVDGLSDSHHLEDPTALATLAGHEKRHAVLRKWFGNDINFSSPTKSDLIQHDEISEARGNRESGLWFELNAIGDKYTFMKSEFTDDMTRELLITIKESWQRGRVPALNEEQVLKFWRLRADHNQEVAFEYVTQHIIE